MAHPELLTQLTRVASEADPHALGGTSLADVLASRLWISKNEARGRQVRGPAHGIPHVKFWVDPHGGIALTTGEAETTTLVAGMPTPPVSSTAVAPAPPRLLLEDA